MSNAADLDPKKRLLGIFDEWYEDVCVKLLPGLPEKNKCVQAFLEGYQHGIDKGIECIDAAEDHSITVLYGMMDDDDLAWGFYDDC